MYIYVHKMYVEVLCAFFMVFMCVGRVCFSSPTADMYFGLDAVCWTNPPSYACTGCVCSPWHIHANLSMYVFPSSPHPLLPHTHSSLTPTLSSLSSSLHSPSSHPPHPHILSLYTIFIPLLLPSIQQLNSLEVRSEQVTFVVHHLTMLNRLVIKLRMHMGLQH